MLHTYRVRVADPFPFGAVAEDDVAFGLFEAEGGKSGMESLALVATPDGPLLTYSGLLHYPKIDRTHIEIIDFYHWLGGTAYTRNIRYIDDGGI